ncbi:MAG: hypothetical protein ACMUIU_12055 [bacterium]
MKKGGFSVLVISLILALIISLSYYFFSYKPKQDEFLRVSKKIQDLESEIKIQGDSIVRDKEAIAQMELGRANLNYFVRNRISGEEKTPFFLRELNKIANTLGIQLISVFPVAPEDKTGYIKEAFEIKLKTDFKRLLRLLLHLQDNLGLNIDQLKMEMIENDATFEIICLMKINTIEMINKEDQKAEDLEGLRALHLKSEPGLQDIKLDTAQRDKDRLAASNILKKEFRDPFEKPPKIREIQEKLKQMETELAESQLLGIIDFEGQRHAIIGRNTVKKGDRIFNMDVLDITHDKVVLGIGEVRFTYKIKKDGS